MDTTLRMLAGPPKENLPYVKGILDFLFFVFMCMGDIFRMDICTWLMCLLSTEAIRVCPVTWNQTYDWSWATMWVLEIKPRSFGRTVSILNHRSISPASWCFNATKRSIGSHRVWAGDTYFPRLLLVEWQVCQGKALSFDECFYISYKMITFFLFTKSRKEPHILADLFFSHWYVPGIVSRDTHTVSAVWRLVEFTTSQRNAHRNSNAGPFFSVTQCGKSV